MKKLLVFALVSLFSFTGMAAECTPLPSSTVEYKSPFQPLTDIIVTADAVTVESDYLVNKIETVFIKDSFYNSLKPDFLKIGLSFKIIDYEFYCKTIINKDFVFYDNSKNKIPDLKNSLDRNRRQN